MLPVSCASPPPTQDPGTATPAVAPTAGLTATPAPIPATLPPIPSGSDMVAVPEAGIRLPVPDGWERVDAAALSAAATRARLLATYPGSERLLGSMDELGGRAVPVFLALDPSAASLAAPVASSLSVMVSQPSVGGFMLDFVSGFIERGLTQALGVEDPPVRDRVDLAAGEAIRLSYRIPSADHQQVLAYAWVIGAPSGTLLVTLLGTAAALGNRDPDEIAAAIALDAAGSP